ncbi:arsenate-mycothiol transferase ArsC [Mycobacterium branderi]|uniref:Low molecular weight phosphatase family protein n=1 Tax=Mycobacterium branderi TaxID=43348 RepID=A0A7I7WAN6_9MYCO|nr:low molecular weight phosphatase family protein [Mycobacterium branderi]MCV7232533.1 low molecular weight phosphatase family protein [Mycobacterium branderi]ORA40697.1 low molecular weight phosphatase family protein [Mycobacterium branderi]BBZ14564.1 low molecular weight phosphatase family protein [Mycobacterium branderi]
MTTTPPTVLFICVSNAGKSVMAAGLMRHIAGPTIHVTSAGTRAKTAVNDLSAQALAEIGVDISDHRPVQLTDQMLDDADLVVIVGTQAELDHPGTTIQRWDTDEPSLRGIDGIERMRIIRDDINTRVQALAAELADQSS